MGLNPLICFILRGDIYKREINVDRWSNAIRWSDKLDEDNFSLFKDVLVIILIISAIISIFLKEIESTIVIFVVLTINAILGTYQYQKAQKSLSGLRNLSSPICYVIRNNEVVKIKSYDLVCGDVVIINTGDIISADGRIIEEESLEVNESSLTGESIPIKKNNKIIETNSEISEQLNMLFSGTNGKPNLKLLGFLLLNSLK